MPDRLLNPGEAHGCFVGGGECKINAAYEIDDGEGGLAYICIPHKLEFERMEKIVEELSPEIFAKLKAAVDKAHGNIK